MLQHGLTRLHKPIDGETGGISPDLRMEGSGPILSDPGAASRCGIPMPTGWAVLVVQLGVVWSAAV